MATNIESLRKFFDSVKSIGFWNRLFGWNRIKNQLIDATADLERLLTNLANLEDRIIRADQSTSDITKDMNLAKEETIKKQLEIDNLNLRTADDSTKILSLNTQLSSVNASLKAEQEVSNRLTNRNDLLSQKNDQLTAEVKRLSENEGANALAIATLTNRKGELEIEVTGLKKDLERTQEELTGTRDLLVQLQTDDENRRKGHDEQLATLKQFQDKIQVDREQEINSRHAAEIERLEKMKQTWINHQDIVKQTLKTLCNKHTIEYIDKVNFKGEPDNTVAICGEFIIFDAKSPRGEDLTNFPNYLKEQSEKAKKYANEENVKKWIFFVVPTNTLEAIKTFVFHLADYQVFVVTIDALEPIILSLKKVEEYEFADQFSPEDRESICRILGKFAHLSKRRIQIDAYFINQFMELAYKCENDLPADVLERASQFEKAEILNPPLDKRSKTIPLGELEKSMTKVRSEASNRGISVDDNKLTDGLNEVPLYNTQ